MNIRGKKKEDLKAMDLVVLSTFEQKGGKGYNVAIAARNDIYTQKDIKAGKAGWDHPMLKNVPIKDKETGEVKTTEDGKVKYSNSIGLWTNQFEAIKEAGKGFEAEVQGQNGEKYTQIPFKADIFVDKEKGHLMINTKTIQPPTKKFDPDKHKKNTKLANDYAKQHAAEREVPQAGDAQAQAQVEAQAEGPEV